MNHLRHCAVDILANCDYGLVIENLLNGHLLQPYIDLYGTTGALYSHLTINKIIEEELLHDHFAITTAGNSSLKSMSSGEQKKALLQYIIQQQPGFIVVDNVLDNLDIAAQENIIATLTGLAQHTTILQVITRTKDILPFIETVFVIQHNTIAGQQTVAAYLDEKINTEQHHFPAAIPASLHHYRLPPGPLVQLRDVSVSYEGRPVLDGISWTINAGEFWQLAGPNGSGKSTIVNLITGDNPKGYGQNINLFGMQKGTGETVWDIKQYIGYLNATMAQFFPRLDSAEQMVLSGFFDSIGLYCTPNETQVKTAQAWLQLIHLQEEKNKAFCFLPLYKQRLILVARAMVKHPPLLILDEPTSGLGDAGATIFTALINRIAATTATAILYVSHRKEQGLNPQYIFELQPSITGSAGKIKDV